MKRIIYVVLMISLALALYGCGNNEETIVEEVTKEEVSEEQAQETESTSDVVEENAENVEESDGIDVDLTTLSSTMVYAEVYNMYMYPDDYIGEIVKMEGTFYVLEVEETGMRYFSVIIEDALGCCAQGVEFELAGDYAYPDDYPEIDSVVTVIGEFETYEEYGTLYCRLKDATLTISE